MRFEWRLFAVLVLFGALSVFGIVGGVTYTEAQTPPKVWDYTCYRDLSAMVNALNTWVKPPFYVMPMPSLTTTMYCIVYQK